MAMVFDHIGIFVRELTQGREYLSSLLPIKEHSKEIDDPLLKVRIQFLTDTSGTRYELVAPFGPGNPVEGSLAAGKNILNHVAYRVSDIEVELARMGEENYVPLSEPQPAVAFGGSRVVFIYTSLKFVLELIEDKTLA